MADMENRMTKIMAGLTEQFLSGVPAVINVLNAALSQLESDEGGKEEQTQLFRQGHDLKGMGGSFGYPIMGTIGGEICRLAHEDIELSSLNLPLLRIHIDLLNYVLANRIKDESDPKAAPIIAAMSGAKPK